MRNYIGHKNIDGVFHKIINNIPYHNIYIEAFAGSGTIANKLFDNGWYGTAIHINDINKEVTDKMQYPLNSIITNLPAVQLLLPNKVDAGGTANLTNPSPPDTAIKFYFLDPPYLHSSRTSKSLYKYEMTDNDHIELLSAVQLCSDKVMVIHPKCAMYDYELKHFRTVQLKIRYNNKTSIECLYMNYDTVKYPMITAFLGDNCWKRQRIKRNSEYNNSKWAGTASLF